MLDKEWQYWATACGALLYTAARDAEKAPLKRRVVKITSTALLAFGLAETVSGMIGVDELLAMAFLVVGGHLTLDVLVAVLSDRKLWTDFIRGRLGGRDG